MRIETELEVWRDAYYMKDNKVEEGEITRITTNSAYNWFGIMVTTVTYYIRVNWKEVIVYWPFKDRQELLNSL